MIMILSLIAACTPSVDTSEVVRTAAEVYIREHVNELSPRSAVLGGTWYVTDIAWQSDGSAVVTYEDGHMPLSGVTSITKRGDVIAAERFTHIMIDGETVETPFSKEGEVCGGIKGITCEPHLFCTYDGAYPDTDGICIHML